MILGQRVVFFKFKHTELILACIIILVFAACFNYSIDRAEAAPFDADLPGVQEIDLPASLCTNVAVITGRADGPHVSLKINGQPVNIGEDGRFAAEVFWPVSTGGEFLLHISSETNGAHGAFTHKIAAFPAHPVLYFAATEYTNDGFAALCGRVNPSQTSALIAMVIPPVIDSSVLETSLPGQAFFSGAAETVIKNSLGNAWRRVLGSRGESNGEDSQRGEEQVVPWEVSSTTFYVPFDAAGSFSFCVPLFAGPNTIVLAAVTPKGDVYSQARRCFYDFPLTLNPLPGQTSRSLLVVSGTTRPGNKVTVNVTFKVSETTETNEQYTATVLADGRFYTPVVLHEGENRISVAVSEEVSYWSGKTGQNIVHGEHYVTPQPRTVKYVPAGTRP